MPKATRLTTNFTAGELSPRIEGRPDLAKYYNGAKIIENFLIFPQGGITRRPGIRYVNEVKDSSKKTRAIEFIFNASQAYVLEFGNQYIRFYKNGVQIKTSAAGPAYEISSPYVEADLFSIQYRQSADVLYLVHPSYAQRKLSRLGDTNWVLSTITFDPPPSFEADTDISGGTVTLTPGATTGNSVIFTASSAVFLQGDVGRQIIYGASRAVIVAFGASAGDTGSPNDQVRADILDAFPNINPIAAGNWFLRLSPQATLDPDKKEPKGGQVTLVAGTPSFRSTDVGKYIKIYGGLVKVTNYDSVTQVKGQIRHIMSNTADANPVAAPTGSWTLEVEAWSASRGYPRAVEFHEGRLLFGGTASQPTTWWGSVIDDYENISMGPLADDAVEYTIASRRVNFVRWLLSLRSLFIGTTEDEMVARGPGIDDPLGGDTIPLVRSQSNIGSMDMMPLVLSNGFLFAQTAGKQVYDARYNIDEDAFTPTDATILSEHITGDGLVQDKLAYQKQPNSIVYMVRKDGQLLALTYYRVPENVLAWSRIVTDGEFESVCAIPHPDGDRTQIWAIVKRTINGATKRYIEYFDDKASEFSIRNWQELFTDCAKVYDGVATTTITGLSHLEAKDVDVVADGSYKGQKTVTGGSITLDEEASKVEIGLHYMPWLKTMRPSIPDAKFMVEGIRRRWVTIFLRLINSIGAQVNGAEMIFNIGGQAMDSGPPLFTGDKEAKGTDWDMDGYITVAQNQPYPLTILAIFGELTFGDRM